MYTEQHKKKIAVFFCIRCEKYFTIFHTYSHEYTYSTGDEELINETSYCAAASIDFIYFFNVIGIPINVTYIV